MDNLAVRAADPPHRKIRSAHFVAFHHSIIPHPYGTPPDYNIVHQNNLCDIIVVTAQSITIVSVAIGSLFFIISPILLNIYIV